MTPGDVRRIQEHLELRIADQHVLTVSQAKATTDPDQTEAGVPSGSRLEQYVFMFTSNLGFPITDSNILLTPQDIQDIIAFLRLL